jgi:hypothetical protein
MPFPHSRLITGTALPSGTYFYLIYSIDLEIKYTADVSRSVSYIDIKLGKLTEEFGWSKLLPDIGVRVVKRLSDLGARLVKGFT